MKREAKQTSLMELEIALMPLHLYFYQFSTDLSIFKPNNANHLYWELPNDAVSWILTLVEKYWNVTSVNMES